MGDSFVSRKDRIIASAIEIISESGLSALTTKNLALKENMSEALMYKYFGGIDEVLVEVVETYSKFDKGIRQTVQAKDATYVEKLIDYLEAYATYYDNYYAISTLMLQYEELLHIVETRERIAWCITERLDVSKSNGRRRNLRRHFGACVGKQCNGYGDESYIGTQNFLSQEVVQGRIYG